MALKAVCAIRVCADATSPVTELRWFNWKAFGRVTNGQLNQMLTLWVTCPKATELDSYHPLI